MDITKSDNNNIKDIINSRFFKLSFIALGIIFSLIGAKVLGLYEKMDPVFVNSILFSGFFVLVFLFSKCKDNKLIPYFLLQFVTLWIFLNQDFFAPVGLNLKPHALVFGICFLVTLYYIFTNFKYLWASTPFKLLLFFFILNFIYAFFYSSDFRSSSYIDTWIQGNVGLKFASLKSGFSVEGREFGAEETRFLKYLTGLLPVISFTAGYMSLYGIQTINEVKKKIDYIVRLFSFTYFTYFVLLIVAILIGTCNVMFLENRLRLNVDFTGTDFEGLFLLLLISFNFYMANFSRELSKNWLKYIISLDMVVLALLILLGIKKGTILSFAAGAAIIAVSSFFFKEKIKAEPITKSQKNMAKIIALALSPLLLVLPMFLINQDFVNNTLYNIFDRFSTTETLEVRTVNWYYYLRNWAENLNLFTAIFGFGTDVSRETSFFLSAMQPDKSYQQPHIHNIYLEYFYNWGLMALLFFMPMVTIMWRNILNIIKRSVPKVIKLFSAVSCAMIIFFFIYYTAESPGMPTNITFFAFLGFLESVKMALSKFGVKDLNGYAEIPKSV